MGNRFEYKHGLSGHPLYYTYIDMKDRCYSPTAENYYNYGAKGITVCEEWISPSTGIKNFITWAESNGWNRGLQLDRENNNGDYSPENCRWVTPKQNARNRKNHFFVDLNGKQVSLAEAMDYYGAVVSRYTVKRRILKGWSTEKAALTPISKKPKVED
jgi:hypothetical protein